MSSREQETAAKASDPTCQLLNLENHIDGYKERVVALDDCSVVCPTPEKGTIEGQTTGKGILILK